MLHLTDIYYEIGDRVLLDNAKWVIPPGKRTALIGPNGAGKSTLLKIIYGKLEASGKIVKPKDYLIGYLPQEEIVMPDASILDIALEGRQDLLELEHKIQELHVLLEQPHDNHDALLDQLGVLEQKFQLAEGYQIEAKAKSVLTGLGFQQKDFARNLSEFSGGWRMRVYLAQLLLKSPDLLLLDEPTNHLDLESLEWLESYLTNFSGAIVIVSHDRFFIDRLTQEIAELQDGLLTTYAGNYHFYEKEKVKRIELLQKQNEQLAAERKKTEDFVERFRYKATKAKQVQSRVKMLNKMQGRAVLPSSQRNYSFQLQVQKPSYKDVLQIQDAFFKYTDEWILEHLDLNIYRGEKLALVGINGAGKTTLTRLMAGEFMPQQGSVKIGERVQIGYYAQHQIDALTMNATVYDEIAAHVGDDILPRIRNVLGLFGFSDDDVFKKIHVLSGGEKARVSLAKILLSPVNFLIMDEPTNHLDIISKQALETALQAYDGTLVIISHDRYFLDKVVSRIIQVSDKKLTVFEGNYSDYLEKREQHQSEEQNVIQDLPESKAGYKKSKEEKRKEAAARQAISKKRNELDKKIEQLETRIEEIENRISSIEQDLCDPKIYQNEELARNIHNEYNCLKDELLQVMQNWESDHEHLEEILSELE